MPSLTALAKINLGLHVLRRRADGYHDIDTVFLKVGWHDVVSVEPADALSLTCSDPLLPVDETNLCLKAARALAAAMGTSRGAAIHLEKKIPFGAGLGGGSSDAAITLRLLNELWQAGKTEEELIRLGAGLGADVPVFVGEELAYRGEGIGEQLSPLVGYQFPYHLTIVMPPVTISTPEAYQWVTPDAMNRVDLPELVMGNDLDAWRVHLVNDFEQEVIDRRPTIGRVKDALYDAGAGYASMSGSGAAVFGVFESRPAAEQAAEQFRQNDYRVWTG